MEEEVVSRHRFVPISNAEFCLYDLTLRLTKLKLILEPEIQNL